jgi:hypothetical protein
MASVITKESADDLALAVGEEVRLVVKARPVTTSPTLLHSTGRRSPVDVANPSSNTSVERSGANT